MTDADIGLALFLGGCLLWAIFWGLLALALHAYNRAEPDALGSYLGIGITLGWAIVLILAPLLAICVALDAASDWTFQHLILRISNYFRALFDRRFPDRVGIFTDDEDDEDDDDDDDYPSNL